MDGLAVCISLKILALASIPKSNAAYGIGIRVTRHLRRPSKRTSLRESKRNSHRNQ